MKKVNTHFTAELNTKSDLFRRVFLLQIRLQEHADDQFDYHQEVRELIESIDRLMHAMIEPTPTGF